MKKLVLYSFITVLITTQYLHAQSLAFRNQDFSRTLSSAIQEDFTATGTLQKKSVGLGILYSLLLPGMGELYAGDYSLGKYFTIADVALWGTLAGTKYYGDMKKDDYIAYAVLHADVNPAGKDDTYWGTIGNYDDINIYNDEMELMREFDKVYDVNTHYWKWDEVANRKKYRSMRNSSETAYNNMKFIVSALILNRIASAVHTVLIIKRHNKFAEKAEMNFGVGVNYVGRKAVGFSLNFAGRF